MLHKGDDAMQRRTVWSITLNRWDGGDRLL